MAHWLPAYPSTRSAVATISDQTVYFGADTYANTGGAKLVDSLGNEVDVTAVSGSTGWSVSGGRISRSSAPNNGAVLSCTTALGTVNVTIATIANAWSAATAAEIGTVIDLSNSSTTALAGKTLYLRPGSYDTTDNHYIHAVGAPAATGVMNYRNRFRNMTGTFTIRPHGAQWSSTINFWRIWAPEYASADTGDITFRDIAIYRTMASFKEKFVGGSQIVPLFLIDAGYGNPRNLSFIGCKFASDMLAGRTGAYLTYSHYPQAIFNTNSIDNMTVQDCVFEYLAFGIAAIRGDNWLIDNNEYRYNKADFMQISAPASNITISNNVWHNATIDGVYHPDWLQGFNYGGADDVGPVTIEGNIIFQGYETNRGVVGSTADANMLLAGDKNGTLCVQNGGDYTLTAGSNGLTHYSQEPSVTGNIYRLPQASTAASGYNISASKRNGTAVPLEIRPYAGDTINGSTASIFLEDYYESVYVVKQSSTNWTATMDDAQTGPVRRFSSFSLTSNDYARIFWCDASGGPITVDMPQASSLPNNKYIQFVKSDQTTNAVTIRMYSGDSWRDLDDGSTETADIVLDRPWATYGFKSQTTSTWYVDINGGTGAPQWIFLQSLGTGNYKNWTVRGNIVWAGTPHTITVPDTPENVIAYNNTVIAPLTGDINEDGVYSQWSDGTSTAAGVAGWGTGGFSSRNVAASASGPFTLDNYTGITLTDRTQYTTFFAGDDLDTDFMPMTRQQAIDMARPRSSANNKYGAVGTSDENGYWNFTTRQANAAPDAPAIISLTPPDGSLSMPTTNNMVARFSHPIKKGTGNIVLRQNNSGWSDVETFDAASSSLLTWTDNKLTINPTSDLTAGREYAIRIASTAVVSRLYNNTFAGIANDTSWSFTAMTPSSQNLLTGSNTFDGSAVWGKISGTGTCTVAGGANSVTGEPYSTLETVSNAMSWRYDTSNTNCTGWTVAGSTAYTFSIYLKRGTTFNLTWTLITLVGGSLTTSTVTFNTGTGTFSGSLNAAHSGTIHSVTDLGGGEYRAAITITSLASTDRVIWELGMPSGTNSLLLSSSKVTTSGLDAYSPGY